MLTCRFNGRTFSASSRSRRSVRTLWSSGAKEFSIGWTGIGRSVDLGCIQAAYLATTVLVLDGERNENVDDDDAP